MDFSAASGKPLIDAPLPLTDEALATLEQRPEKQRLHQSLGRNLHMKCLALTLLVIGFSVSATWCGLYSIIMYRPHYFPDFDMMNQIEYPCHVRVFDTTFLTTRKPNPVEINDVALRKQSFIHSHTQKYMAIPIVGAVLCYIFYIIECLSCDTRYTIERRVDLTTLMQRIEQMRFARPIVWWRAICYHYAPHSRQIIRYRGGGESFPATQQYYERVNTHAAGTTFDYTHCGMQDVSKIVVGMNDYGAVKVRISKGFAFANRKAAREFEQQRSSFFQQHEARDEFMEMREGLDLLESEFVDYVLAYQNKAGAPWYIYPALYWVASAILLSWPLRVLIEYRTAFLDLSIIKLFGVNYFDSADGGGSSDPSPRGSVAIGNSLQVPEEVEAQRTCAAVRRLSQLHLAHLAFTAANANSNNNLLARSPTTPATIAEVIDELSEDDSGKLSDKSKTLGKDNGEDSSVTQNQRYHFSHSYTTGDNDDTEQESANNKRAFTINNANIENGGSLKDRIERPMIATASRLGLGGRHHRRRRRRSPAGGATDETMIGGNDDNVLSGGESGSQHSSAQQWRRGIVTRGTVRRSTDISQDENQTQEAPLSEKVDELGQRPAKKKKHRKKPSATPPSYQTALEASKPIVLPRSQAERLLRSPATPKNDLHAENRQFPTVQSPQPMLLSIPNAAYAMPTPSTSSSRRVSVAGHVIVVSTHAEYNSLLDKTSVNHNSNLLLPTGNIAEQQRRRSSALSATSPSNPAIGAVNGGLMPAQQHQHLRRPSRQHETTI